MRRLSFVIAALALAACASTPPSEAEAWEEVRSMTSALYLGNDRLKVAASKPLTTRTEHLEYALLARAAGEAVRRGSDRFVIVEAEYEGAFDLFGMELEPLGRGSIGTYEELVEARERETEGFGAVRRVSYVVRFLPEESVLQESFGAEDTYGALIDNWINRRR